ncbi:PLP-dependent aminotransferase family protein [Pantoea sp. GD03673]|uniref:aminotransferase-like domain-containing protein n=1 Tax=Pantoea sp. GD03673 TaxID=2975364 RepID=UPI00244711FB|nr:PLP-dependent aminotransferase family protein [Pantoea sp. GD03673]MDH2066846.1 PLP-dependent aminotransferase family protein [Pantoea sp. GD03673]
MVNALFTRWATQIQQQTQRPAYLRIADFIAEGIASGELPSRYRLPPLRELAEILDLNYTTVTRGYAEARRMGLIDSRPGLGSFIRNKASSASLVPVSSYEMTMNAPVEPAGHAVEDALRTGAINLFNSTDMLSLMRYQDFGGSAEDKAAAIRWMSRKLSITSEAEVLVCPGIHSALFGLMTLFKRKKGCVCVSSLVYPGMKAIANHLDIRLKAVLCDEYGPDPSVLEAHCRAGEVTALYINPTLHNPTTLTLPEHRRRALADVCRRYNISVIEDDAYAALSDDHLPAFAELIPELTWYVTGMSKCFGPGLRIAFLKGPNGRATERLAGVLRALTVMSSPFTNALARQWINDGTAERMLKEIKSEAKIRQQMASFHLSAYEYQADNNGYHLWLPLPKMINSNSSDVAAKLREKGISAVSGVAFCTDNNPVEALRLCLGGSQTREQCEERLKTLSEMLADPFYFSGMAI